MAERRTLDLIVRDPESRSSLALSSVYAEGEFVELRGVAHVFSETGEELQGDVILQIGDDEGADEALIKSSPSDWRFLDLSQKKELRIEDYSSAALHDLYRIDSGRVLIDGRTFDGFSISDPFPIVAVVAIVVGGALLGQSMVLGTAAYVYLKQGKTPRFRAKTRFHLKDVLDVEFDLGVDHE